MRPLKKILATETVQRCLCWLAAQYIRLVYVTGRWTTICPDSVLPYREPGNPFVICFWHGRIIMMPCGWKHRDTVHMLISQHRDGKIIARTVGHFDVKIVAGSTRHGGAAALRAMLKVLESGACVGITPDGPRGPRMRASDGIVNVARLAGKPIIPASFSITRRKVLSTWDRLVIPLPFGRGVFIWGEPIFVPSELDEAGVEEVRRKVEDSLNGVTVEADRLTGFAPMKPDVAAGESA